MISSVQSRRVQLCPADLSKIFSSKFYMQAIQAAWKSVFTPACSGIIAVFGSYSRRAGSTGRCAISMDAFANMTSNFAGVPPGLRLHHPAGGSNGSITIMLKQAGDHSGLQPVPKTGLIILFIPTSRFPSACCCSTRPLMHSVKTGRESASHCSARTAGGTGGTSVCRCRPRRCWAPS